MHRALLLALLAGVVLAVPGAEAQISSSLTLAIEPPTQKLTPDHALALAGRLTYIADITAVANLQGIPVTYHVTNAPAWAAVVVTPASDVLPIPLPTLSPSILIERTFTLTLVGDPAYTEDDVGLVEIEAVVHPGNPGSRGAHARVTVPVSFDAPEKEEPCEEHVPIEEIAYAYLDAMPQAQPEPAAEEDGGTTVQSSTSKPLALPLAAVAGFAAVGAGVGLLLRRRLQK